MRRAQSSVVATRDRDRLVAAPSPGEVTSSITITGLADHDRPEWPITMTGMRIAQPSTSPTR